MAGKRGDIPSPLLAECVNSECRPEQPLETLLASLVSIRSSAILSRKRWVPVGVLVQHKAWYRRLVDECSNSWRREENSREALARRVMAEVHTTYSSCSKEDMSWLKRL